ncbi:hypothetical protein [Sulfolobus acidocaldarius]|uniref:hypothetical protein n=1 Tax=Sulfolobus acidocaldarius TaxID=2285 RepID=UPI001E35B2CA|nr:hypothetical protein [Sulfolobus acidocaldarius]
MRIDIKEHIDKKYSDVSGLIAKSTGIIIPLVEPMFCAILRFSVLSPLLIRYRGTTAVRLRENGANIRTA